MSTPPLLPASPQVARVPSMACRAGTSAPPATATCDGADVVLAERVIGDGRVRWQARRSSDRGRLLVVAVVAPSDTETIVTALTERQLVDLLEGEPANEDELGRIAASAGRRR